MRNRIFPVSILLVLILALLVSVSSAEKPVKITKQSAKEAGETRAALINKGHPNAIPGQFIVVFKKGTSKAMANQVKTNIARTRGNAIQSEWNIINGFSARMTDQAVEALLKNPNIAYVEQDQVVSAIVTWGLDRTDQRNLPLDNSYSSSGDYAGNGSGVHAYIIDTGIRASHNEFSGRVGNGYDFVDNDSNPDDCNGHGTHVAGTVGGSTYGMAPGVTLHGVRVLDCNGSGSYAGVIDGINWVTNNHSSPAVANMSLGGGFSQAVNDAVNNSVAAGVVYAVAAGNDNADACNYSPASAGNAVTVGSTTSSDARSSFSNYGSCVDIFAPGSSITSAWYTGDSATNTISGTSMASPHVAGAAALYRANNPGASASAVGNALTGNATSGVISSVGSGSPNLLLYVGGSSGPNPTPTPAPPTPTPAPGGCSGYNHELLGSLSGTGNSEYWTYNGSTSGLHSASLTGPGNADFDLYLQKKSWFWWSDVASSTSASSNESINYNASSGEYRWQVYSYSGSGNYTLCASP